MIETFKEVADRIQLSYKNPWDDVYCYEDDDDGKIDLRNLFGRQDMNQKIVDCFSTKNEKVEPLASVITCSAPVSGSTTYATISSCPEPENINITFSAVDLKKIGIPISADARTTYDVKCVKNESGYTLEKVTATLNSSCFPPKEINDILKKDEEKETMPTKNDNVMTFVWNKNASNTSDPNSQEKESDPLHKKYPKLTTELKPKRIIFNNPATIVFWEDGTKTVVKLSKGEKFNSYNAFCAALAKKIFENNSRVRAIVKSGVNQHMKDANKKKAKKTSKK